MELCAYCELRDVETAGEFCSDTCREAAEAFALLTRARGFINDVVEGRAWEGCAGREIILEIDALADWPIMKP